MTEKEFLDKLYLALQSKTLYVAGCFGAPMNDKNKERYANYTKYNRQPERQKMIMEADHYTFGFDCVCLIKGILWGWDADPSKVYGGAYYESNDVPDKTANSFFNLCTDITSDFSYIHKGEMVWMDGHCGVYVGNGLVIECSPAWENCVQLTGIKGMCDISNVRKWSKHGRIPFVEYEPENVNKATAMLNTVIDNCKKIIELLESE